MAFVFLEKKSDRGGYFVFTPSIVPGDGGGGVYYILSLSVEYSQNRINSIRCISEGDSRNVDCLIFLR